MSLIDLQEDNIRANEEIQNICDLFANDPNVIVFPIHGCSTEGKTSSRRAKHRAGIGIALFQKYTGFGLGRMLLEILLRKIKEQGYEQAELTVVEGNDRAYHLYESLGFKECGRVPNANKYDDGTYSDDILMVLSLRDEGRNENLT